MRTSTWLVVTLLLLLTAACGRLGFDAFSSLNSFFATETTPELSADGLTLFFSSDRSGGLGAQDAYVTERASRGDPPTPVTELNTELADSDVWVAPDGRTIVFTRNPDGEDDIFMATR